jgi:hypothetical protein
MATMGLQYGLEKSDFCIKRAFRWLFEIPGICADDTPGVNALPPEKSARPSFSFKEMESRHMVEDVYYPAKAEWKPISITLFDLVKKNHPVFEWIMMVYDMKKGQFFPANNTISQQISRQQDKFIKDCHLKLYDGCANVIERWIFEDAWPQAVNFQTLDMSSNGYLTCEITLRYARAYIE